MMMTRARGEERPDHQQATIYNQVDQSVVRFCFCCLKMYLILLPVPVPDYRVVLFLRLAFKCSTNWKGCDVNYKP